MSKKVTTVINEHKNIAQGIGFPPLNIIGIRTNIMITPVNIRDNIDFAPLKRPKISNVKQNNPIYIYM